MVRLRLDLGEELVWRGMLWRWRRRRRKKLQGMSEESRLDSESGRGLLIVGGEVDVVVVVGRFGRKESSVGTLLRVEYCLFR